MTLPEPQPSATSVAPSATLSSVPPEVGPAGAPPILDYQTPKPPSLGQRAVSGMAAGVAGTLITKVLALVQQFVLGYTLSATDFGLVAIANGVLVFATFLRDGGVGTVLIQRGREFDRWSNPAVWISGAIAAVTVTLGLAMIPVALHLYAPERAKFDPTLLTTVLLVLVASGIPMIMVAVPAARLSYDLRFNYLSISATLIALATTVLTVVAAFAGMGPLAIVVPAFAAAVVRLALYWSAAPPVVAKTPEFHKWRSLLGDSIWAASAASVLGIWINLDRVILGYYTTMEEVGHYQFAWLVTAQTAALLSGTAGSVLLPAFGRVEGEGRRIAAFERSTMLLGLVAVPAAFMQAFVAGPALSIVFGSKWDASVPLIWILSVGLAIGLVGVPTVSYLQGRGKFKLMFYWQVLEGLAMVLLATIGARAAGAKGVACATALLPAIFCPIGLWLILRRQTNPWVRIARPMVVPFAVGALASGATYLAIYALPGGTATREAIRLAVIVPTFTAATVGAALLLARRESMELAQLIGGLSRRLLRR